MQGTAAAKRWRTLLFDGLGLLLVATPILVPLLASGPAPLGEAMAALGQRFCPPSESGLTLAGQNLAGCPRLYGAMAGLLMMRWLFHRSPEASYWLEQYGLWGFSASFILCLAYPLGLALQGLPGWDSIAVQVLSGIVAGSGLGAYLMPTIYNSK